MSCISLSPSLNPSTNLLTLLNLHRNEISLSFLTSYTSLPIPSAQQLLFLPSPSEVVAFAQKKGWTISPSSQTIFFPTPSALGGAGVGAAAESGGMKGLIEESLGYARELEAIV